jgi:molybdopterin-guanine dinucleotide biosynthesis protein A
MRHPTFGLWRPSLIDDLRQALTNGVRKIVIWTDSVGGSDVRFEHPSSRLDPFYNVNTPEDLVIAEQEFR